MFVEFVRKASELAKVLVGLADFANTNPEYSEFPVLIYKDNWNLEHPPGLEALDWHWL